MKFTAELVAASWFSYGIFFLFGNFVHSIRAA